MKRLLVIAYAVPPTRGASPGRVGHLIRHLPAHGWEAVVLTPRHPERVVTAEKTREHRNYPIPLRLVHDGGGVPYWLQETGFQELFAGLRKAAGPPAAAEQTPGLYGKRAIDPEAQALEDPPVPKWAWQRLIVTAQSNPDHRAGWVEPGLQAARAVAQALRLDAVYSLSPPVTAHRIAMRAAENLGIPWIAEERERWRGSGVALVDARRRSRILRAARAIGCLHPERLRAKVYRGRATRIRPSFDPRDLGGAPSVPRKLPLVAMHAGPTSVGGRDTGILLEALRMLLDSGTIGGEEIRVRLIGSRDPGLAAAIGSLRLGGIVTLEPEMPWPLSLATQQDASLLLAALGPGDAGRFPDRFLDALTVGRRLLAFGPADAATASFLRESGVGSHHPDSSSLASALADRIRAEQSGRTDQPEWDEEVIAPFRAERVVAEIVRLIEAGPGKRAEDGAGVRL